MASQSHRICVSDSSFSRHCSQVGLSVNSSLKRRPFRWQCPVNSPCNHLNWCLFNFNKSFFLQAEGPDVYPFACLSPVVASQCFSWFLFVQSLAAFLATPIEMPQAVSGPMNGCSHSVLARYQLFYYQKYSHDLAPISVELCYIWPVVWGIDGSPRPVLRWSGSMSTWSDTSQFASSTGKYVPAFAYTIHQNNPTAELKINLQGKHVFGGPRR
jgi:hypothetical protein